MKQIIIFFLLGFSVLINGQDDLIIKGQVLNFDNFRDDINYFRVSCKIYQLTFPNLIYQDQLFNQNGLFEFSHKIDYPTVAEIRLGNNTKYMLAVYPGDTIDLKIDFAKQDFDINNLTRQNISHDNFKIDSIITNLDQNRISSDNIDSIKSAIENQFESIEQIEQRFFILSYFAYAAINHLSVSTDKDKLLIIYSLFSKYPELLAFDNKVNSIILSKKVNFDMIHNSINDSVKIIEEEFNNVSELIKDIKQRNKDKLIYIDVWATWCGPCKLDMKYKKKLGIDKFFLENDIKSVYLCCRSSHTDWKYYIKKENVKGVHYFLNDSLSDELFNDTYGVKTIPHYYLIDKSGEMIIDDNLRFIKRKDGKISINENFVRLINDL